VSGNKVDYPVIGDRDLNVAKLYNMLPADAGDTAAGRTAANNVTVRTVYMIGPDKKIRAMLLYPMSNGRNFDEVLRLLDSIQLTESKGVATPVNWKQGEDCIIPPSVSDEDARAKYPGGWTTKKPYLRTIPQPQDAPEPVK
jgi:alkyl hydroperoxide reductase subunit AhpC